jgi:hypothetical protein
MFYKFVGRDKQQDFMLRRVVFLQNNKLEQEMSGFYRELMLYEQMRFGSPVGAVTPASRSSSGTEVASESPEEQAWRRWVNTCCFGKESERISVLVMCMPDNLT